MKISITLVSLSFALCCSGIAYAQQQQQQQSQSPASSQPTGAATENASNDPHVALTEQATAADVAGRIAIGGRLRTNTLTGTPDAPTRDVRFVVENRSQFLYNYVSGYATFYDAQNVRCGEGLWKLEALAPAESVEVDTPGLRLTCAPATWRLMALNLLTRTGDIAKPREPASPAASGTSSNALRSQQSAMPASNTNVVAPRLEININGKTLPLQLGNPVEIVVGQERVNIVVNPVPEK